MHEIPLTRPLVGEREQEAAARAVASGWLAQGPRVAELEEAFAGRVGAGWALAVSSGTAALHLSLLAAGVGRGDVVLTVSHSFIAGANAIRVCGAEPVFVDIDLPGYNMSPDRLARTIERDFEGEPGALRYRHREALGLGEKDGALRAIVVAHQVGMPADLGALVPIAERAGVVLIEDAACAAGSAWRDAGGPWRAVGEPAGALACFSFHPRKVITTGEGGMITGRDPALRERLARLRNHGLRQQGERRVYAEVGYNQRMSDVAAAIGLVQLERLEDIVEARRRLVAGYRERLEDLEGVSLPPEPETARSNWQSLILLLDEDRDQGGAIAALAAAGIASQPGIMCAHLEPPYREVWGESRALAASESAYRRGLTVPLFPAMSEAELDRVAAALTQYLRSG